jgi:hypothetical protein
MHLALIRNTWHLLHLSIAVKPMLVLVYKWVVY